MERLQARTRQEQLIPLCKLPRHSGISLNIGSRPFLNTRHRRRRSVSGGNSYGGYWVPETAVQYSKHLSNLPAKHALKSKNLVIDNIGITNACVDTLTGAVGYPEYAYNNTYGVKFASQQLYQEVMNNLTKPFGCLDLTKQCRALGSEGDPNSTGRNATVNEFCMAAFGYCEQYVIGAFPKLNNVSPSHPLLAPPQAQTNLVYRYQPSTSRCPILVLAPITSPSAHTSPTPACKPPSVYL